MKNNKARSIWQKLSASESFNSMAVEYRKAFSIPMGGFESEEEYKKWIGKLIEDEKLNLESLKSMAKIRNHEWGYDLTGMEYVIDEFLHFGKVTNGRLDSALNTGCGIYVITANNRDWVKSGLEDGIYIKIGKNSRPTDIKLFLKRQKAWIKAFQEELRTTSNNKVSKTKYKQSKNVGRDHLIYLLGELSVPDLKKLSGSMSDYKEILISVLMKEKGFGVTPENVRQILHRQKKLIGDK